MPRREAVEERWAGKEEEEDVVLLIKVYSVSEW